MSVIDDRGRVLGRINAVDAAAVVVLGALAALAYSGYRVFALPPPPEVTIVEPPSLREGQSIPLRLGGRHFLPLLRLFVRRSGSSPALAHDPFVHKPGDAFTLVNTTRAPWDVESPDVALLHVPDDLTPGSYDLLFFNETREVARRTAAFTVTPGPQPPPSTATDIRADHDASVAVRFVCRPEVAAAVAVGDQERVADGQPARARIVSVGARRDAASHATISDGARALRVDEPAVTLDAVLEVPVANVDGDWMHNGAPMKAGAVLTFETSAYKLRGWILAVSVARARRAGSPD